MSWLDGQHQTGCAETTQSISLFMCGLLKNVARHSSFQNCESSVQDVLHVPLLASRSWRWPQEFLKFYRALWQYHKIFY